MLNWNDVLDFANKKNPKPEKRVEKTESEWKEFLSDKQFQIARLKGTESAHSGALCNAYEAGVYSCICCSTDLFDSTIKFDSGSGWPSFTQPIKENSIKYHKDTAYGMERIEVMCNTCDCHLGHVFPDGPAPSGLRYCVNSESIKLQEE